MANKANPKQTTGIFTTRKQLEAFVIKSANRKKNPITKADIAKEANVSYGVVARILSAA